MTLTQLRRAVSKRLLDVFIGAIGFLAALLINSLISESNDLGAYRSIMNAIHVEARLNRDIATYTLTNASGSIASREFSDTVTLQALANPVFVQYIARAQLSELGRYTGFISSANTFRHTNEMNKFSCLPQDAKETTTKALEKNWRGDAANLKAIAEAIEAF